MLIILRCSMWPGRMESQGEATVNEIEDQERRISGGETPQLRRGYDGAGQQLRRAAAEEEEAGDRVSPMAEFGRERLQLTPIGRSLSRFPGASQPSLSHPESARDTQIVYLDRDLRLPSLSASVV